jgi:pyrimidine-nucleoside phosphorylase
MRAVDLIRTKRDGGALSRDGIHAFVRGVTDGSIPSYQAAALLMAIRLRGMTPEETAALTDAMARSGTRLDLSRLDRPTVDKHSTGGVGDKTSLVIAPLVAACGAVVPMMSGRGLGHTGGTLDKLEAIPGLRTALDPDAFLSQLDRIGCAIVGQTESIAPADKVLYALRDVTATVDSIPLISASIMSKKIAEGVSGLVLDVKTGSGAFMKDEGEAMVLARSMVDAGRRSGVRTQAVITSMDAPLGVAVGNAVEVAECVDVMRGAGPADLRELCLELSARMLTLAGIERNHHAAFVKATRVLDSGEALDRFRLMVEAQGGDPACVDDPGRLPTAPSREMVPAPRFGYVEQVDAEAIGRAAVALGAGRDRADAPVDPGVGIFVRVRPGEAVEPGQPVLEILYRSVATLEAARSLANAAVRVGNHVPVCGALIRSEVR